MGNRAVITTKEKDIGIYLHWNGGPQSICAFLTYAKAYGVRNPDFDRSYSLARITQIICNFLGGTASCGIGAYDHLDTNNGDNGTYIIGKDFNVIERLFATDYVETVRESEMREFLKEIDRRMVNHALDEEEKLNLDKVEFVTVPGLSIKKGE